MQLLPFATDAHVDEALRLFQVSTLDAAMSGSLAGTLFLQIFILCCLFFYLSMVGLLLHLIFLFIYLSKIPPEFLSGTIKFNKKITLNLKRHLYLF